MFIGKYENFDSEIWGYDILYNQHISLDKLHLTLVEEKYFNIPITHILEHTFFMTEKRVWPDPNGICSELSLYPHKIELLSIYVQTNSDKLKELVNGKPFCGCAPPNFNKYIFYRNI